MNSATDTGSASLPAAAPASATLAFGPGPSFSLGSNDPGVIDWLTEFFGPALTAAEGAVDWQLTLSSAAGDHAALCARRPADAELRPCFALDQRLISLPTWSDREHLLVADDPRSCIVRARPRTITIAGDPGSRRWRFTLVFILYELVATRFSRTHLELHAAAVEVAGRAIVLIGPKLAGKTTLALQLLRSGRWRAIANDRVFAGEEGGALTARGVPTPVKIRPTTLAGFPELHQGLPWIERPFLYSVAELEKQDGTFTPSREDLPLTPAQLAHRLGVEPLASAPFGALLFPQVRVGASGWALERLRPEEVAAEIKANLWAGATRRTASTVFADLDGGRSLPPNSLAPELAESLPGYRFVLGRGAYDDPDFAERLLERLALR